MSSEVSPGGSSEASPGGSTEAPPRARHPRRNVIIAITVVSAVAFGVAYALVLGSFNSDAKTAAREFKFGLTSANINTKNNFEIDSSVVGVDTDKNLLTLRLVFFYKDPTDYSDANGALLGDPSPNAAPAMTLYVVSDTGTQVVPFHAGAVLPVTDVNVNLNGRVTNYPFDHYNATVDMFLVGPDGHTQVPTLDFLNPGVHGFSVDTTSTKLVSTDTASSVRMRIDRATSSRFFSYFIMALLWALALAAVAMALVVVLQRRGIGAGILGFLAVLLFAFPQMRASLPGVPGVGAKVDYLAFFWAETIVAITLVVLAVVWIFRAIKHEEEIPFVDVG